MLISESVASYKMRAEEISEVFLKLFRGVPVAPDMKQNPASLIQFKTTTPPFLVAIALVLACIWFLPTVRAVSPAPDGGYPGGNTAEGQNALLSLTAGGYNTAVGYLSLRSDTTGNFNTAVGAGTLLANTADRNTAIGAGALLSNTTGIGNTAVGASALFDNTDGGDNNAVGSEALQSNVSGNFNNAHGRAALEHNVEGNDNNALGDLALLSNVSGSFNTAIGDDALISCTEGNSNVAIGDEAGTNLVDGEGNIYIGARVNTGGSSEFEFIRIGDDTAFTFPYDTFIAGIFDRDVDTTTAVFVFVDDTGKLGTNLVDAAGNKVATPQAMLNESRNQQKRIAELEGTVARLAGMVKEQAAQIQKVSAQLEMSKPLPHVVVNKP